MKILFVLKYRGGYTYDCDFTYSYGGYFSSGLYWSAKFVVDMLVESGVDAKLVQVVDNNDIDREVHEFRPDVVIIEALWVLPQKFDVLMKLHPTVQWIVRLHSNIPFLANESIAVKWIKGYARRGVRIAANEKRAFEDFQEILRSSFLDDRVLFLPNYYPNEEHPAPPSFFNLILNVGCYGAIRPLKNQLIQALAAIRYADEHDKILHFHINGTRLEQGGESIRDNLRALFAGTAHSLIEEHWMNHEEFLTKLRYVDVAMQVSLSETFNIVSADAVSVGVPIVVSPEVQWANYFSKVDPTDSLDITKGIKNALRFSHVNVRTNRANLRKYSAHSKKQWLRFLGET